MNARRSKLEIYLDVLKAVEEMNPAKPTRLMYKSNLSWKLLMSITNHLVGDDFIMEVPPSKVSDSRNARYDGRSNRRFAITPKGSALLKKYSLVKDIVGELSYE